VGFSEKRSLFLAQAKADMKVEIIPIPLGIVTAYVLRADGVIAIDTGPQGKSEQFEHGLARAGIRPSDVQLIVLTHGHWDHVGSARDIKTLTGGKLAIHEADRACLEQSLIRLPPGTTRWGKIFIAIERLFLPRIRIPAVTADIILGDEPLPLREYGLPGRILHTPGHSPGSVTILLDSGEAFVGDLAMNGFPLRWRPGLPIVAEDPAAVIDSWHRLLDAGARTIYPAHGKRFSADVMRDAVGA
jgi:hydroxyacylglutathione hydrolase